MANKLNFQVRTVAGRLNRQDYRLFSRFTGMSRHAESAQAIDYMLTRWLAFTCLLDDCRSASNNRRTRAVRYCARARRGCSRAPTAAASGRLQCTPCKNVVFPLEVLPVVAVFGSLVSAILGHHPAVRVSHLLSAVNVPERYHAWLYLDPLTFTVEQARRGSLFAAYLRTGRG
jgi:hypothetical protein